MSATRTPRAPRERLHAKKGSQTLQLKKRKQAQPKTCCDEPDIQDYDGSRVCFNCGTQISENNIVSDVTFGETSSGAAVVQGSHVGENQRHAKSMGMGFRRGGGGGVDSREQTEHAGRDELRKLSGALHLPTATEDQAFGVYKLAAGHNFIQGRRTREVAAVCLYVACRRSKTNTVLLIDLADKIEVSVFYLGAVYKALVKEIFLGDFTQSGTTAVIEIEPLILKFARKLEFGAQTFQVAEDAAKLVKRMNRDWMVTGRQPAGLCGACLILAARMNNFRRSTREVVYIVKVSDVTIAKRLEEFGRTLSGRLSVEEFRKYGQRIKHQADPPVLYETKMKEEKRKRKRALELGSTESTPQPEAMQPALTTEPQQELRRDAEGFAIPALPIDPTLLASSETAANTTEVGEPPKKKRGRPKKEILKPLKLTENDLLVEDFLDNEIEQIITDPDMLANVDDETFSHSQAKAKTLADAHRAARGGATVSESEDLAEDEFDDDPEVAHCLLSPAEIAIKERIWVTHNEDWLRSQQAKLQKKNLEEASGITKQKAKRKRRHLRIGEGGLDDESPASSPAEASQRMLARRGKGFSKHINYDALNNIMGGKSRSTTPAPTSGAASRRGSTSSTLSSQRDVSQTPAPTSRQAAGAQAVLPTPPTTQVLAPQQSVLPQEPRRGSQDEPEVVESGDEGEEDEEDEDEDMDEGLDEGETFGALGLNEDGEVDEYGGAFGETFDD